MANYALLKAAIQDVIKTNGNNEITGALLQQSLLAMINSLGDGFQFIGIATPSTNPGTPDQNVFYIASEAGTYSNFSGIVVAENEVAILKWNGTWTKETSGAATAAQLNQLGQQVIYDVSANNDGATFASLSALLSSENLSTLIPIAVRCGGMSIRFAQTSDNKYVQYFLTKDEWSTSEDDWEKINIENDVQDIIGNYTENVDESKTTEMELSRNMVLLWEIDTKIKIGQDYQVSVLGSFGKNRVRIYANDDYPAAIYFDNTGASTTLIAAQNINKLSYYANCTSVGDSVCTLKYTTPASGMKKNIENNQYVTDSQYLLQCITGGKGPTFNNWGTNVASLFSFSGNNFTAYRGNGFNPDIEKTINVVAGKRYYVLCELNISSLHESGVTLNFRGLKYESVQAQLGKNTIFYEATFDEASSILTYLQFSPNGTSQTGDVIITAECLYFSVIETGDVNVTDKVIEQASERDVYVPKYINGLTLGGKWVALGDSLTGQRKYIPNTMKKMGFDSVLNLGVGGKKASGEDGMWKTDYLSQIPNDASLITLMCGTNDWAQSVVIGDIGSTDTDEYCGALNTIIDYISQNYPQIRFVIMCPPIGVYPNRTGWNAPWIENINGNSMMDFAEAAYQVASNRGIPCARIGQSVGWNDKNISTFITFDGAYLHPNELGGLRISDVLIGFLKTILPL